MLTSVGHFCFNSNLQQDKELAWPKFKCMKSTLLHPLSNVATHRTTAFVKRQKMIGWRKLTGYRFIGTPAVYLFFLCILPVLDRDTDVQKSRDDDDLDICTA